MVFFVFAPSDEEDDESVEEDEEEPDDEPDDEDDDESADEPLSFFCFCGEPDLARLSVA